MDELVEHDLIQGSQEWVAFRLEHDGSSETAAMLGLSKHTTRTALLDMKSTGMEKVFSDWFQKHVLDHGHHVEALARPIIEKQLGRRLFPVVCSRGRPSASCDGKTMAGDVVWEHKQWAEALAESVRNGILPEEHEPQCYQQLMVTGAEKLIFTVSDGTAENMVSMEVLPNQAWFERIKSGWEQFHKDLAAYVPKATAELPQAEISIELPALFVHAEGKITTHNMREFGDALKSKLEEVRSIVLVTDQDFANAKASAKMFREKAKEVSVSKDQMLAQTVTIGEAARMMDAWREDLNKTALQLEKDVERMDLEKKRLMISEAAMAFMAHVESLEAETRPIQLNVPRPDFATAIKGKSKYANMQDAIDTLLSQSKQNADAIAKDIRNKLAWCKENAAGMSMLFPDLQQIITKPMDDFTLLIQSRIDAHNQKEKEKLEAERIRIEAEVKAKAAPEPAEYEPEQVTPEPKATKHELQQSAVIESQDDISSFMAQREFGKDANKIRAILVEFVKHQAACRLKA